MLQLLLFEIFIIVSCHRTCHISGSLKQLKQRNHLINYLILIIGIAFDNQSVVYTVDYTKIKIGDYVPNNQVYFNTADAEVSADGTHETVYRYFYYGMTDENDEGINTDHVTKQHYGGRQALEFTRTKTINTDGQVTIIKHCLK